MSTRIACLVAALLLYPVAAQAHKQKISDARDSPTDVDLKFAKLTHTSRKITITIGVYGRLSTHSLPCPELKLGRQKVQVGCYSEGIEYNGHKYDTTFSKTKNTMSVTFKRKALGGRRTFGWRAAFFENEHPADAVPNKGYKKHSF